MATKDELQKYLAERARALEEELRTVRALGQLVAAMPIEGEPRRPATKLFRPAVKPLWQAAPEELDEARAVVDEAREAVLAMKRPAAEPPNF